MKISAMVGTPDLKTTPIAVFAGQDLAGNLRRAAELGFDGVELMLKDPTALDGDEIRRLLGKNNLQLAGLCSGHVYGEDRLGLLGPDPDVGREAMRRMKALVDFAHSFGPGTVLNVGRSRGRADESNPAFSWMRAVAAFRELADYARPKGVRLAMEPVNHYEINYVITTQDGIRMCRDVDRPNFGLMLDTYHMNIEDVNIYDSIREAKDYCYIVHSSDNNRKWPGNAHIDFPGIIRTLQEIGFEGFLSAEILPWPDSETAGRSTVAYLRRYIGGDKDGGLGEPSKGNTRV